MDFSDFFYAFQFYDDLIVYNKVNAKAIINMKGFILYRHKNFALERDPCFTQLVFKTSLIRAFKKPRPQSFMQFDA